jgi:peroxiredoxin
MPNVGETAPDFTLESHLDHPVSLSDYKGEKRVVLVFYPLDFSPVCSMQLPEYSDSRADFESLDAVVLGINRDSVHAHRAWAKAYGIEVPLLADMTLEVARAYGVALPERGTSKRAVFLVDRAGSVRLAHVEKSTDDFTLHAAEVLEVLRALPT